jgi:hypothetical protein
MRAGKLRYFIFIQSILWLAFLLTLVHAGLSTYHSREGIEMKKRIVRNLGLTDLCLTTEARYTRHPSQADYFTPFQDNPLSLEFFPSGGVMAPPEFNEMSTKIIRMAE